jgi:hypothetical protein
MRLFTLLFQSIHGTMYEPFCKRENLRIMKHKVVSMKKKIIAIMIAAVMLLASACAGFPSVSPRPNMPDINKYAVVGNGGMAVQVGQYIYFINGQAIPERDGSDNVWGRAVRGGIYRAELIEGNDMTRVDHIFGEYTTHEHGAAVFTKNQLNPNFSGFRMRQAYDVDGEPIVSEDENIPEEYRNVMVVDAVPVVNKMVHSLGGERGGLYIFGEYIYFTSPNHRRDRNGNYLTDRLCFYRAKLDGTGGQLLYSAQRPGAVEYGYYHYNGDLYLVVNDTVDGENNIYSVRIRSRASSPTLIARNVTGVAFQNRRVFVNGSDAGARIDDFVYYTRAWEQGVDANPAGNVLERVAPTGRNSTRQKILNNGMNIELLSAHPDALFYFESLGSQRRLMASDLAFLDVEFEKAADGNYVPKPIGTDADGNPIHIKPRTEVVMAVVGTRTNFMAGVLHPESTNNLNSGMYFVIATSGSDTIARVAGDTADRIIIRGTAARTLFRDGDNFFFSSGSGIFRADLFAFNQDITNLRLTHSSLGPGGFFAPVAAVGGFAFFIKSAIEDPAHPELSINNYMAARWIGEGAEVEDWQIYVLDPAEIPDDDDEEYDD